MTVSGWSPVPQTPSGADCLSLNPRTQSSQSQVFLELLCTASPIPLVMVYPTVCFLIGKHGHEALRHCVYVAGASPVAPISLRHADGRDLLLKEWTIVGEFHDVPSHTGSRGADAEWMMNGIASAVAGVARRVRLASTSSSIARRMSSATRHAIYTCIVRPSR